MPREVQFCTEQVSGIRGKIANSLGLGHAGLHGDRGAAPSYVTWDGTTRDGVDELHDA